MPWTRRQFFKGALYTTAAGFVASVGTGIYSYALEPRFIRKKDYTLASSKWPKTHAPLNMAVAGDLHVGCPSINLKSIDGIVERLNQMSPDVIFVLGDFLIGGVWGGDYVEPKPIAEKLAQLKAPFGVYAVLGNHDWWQDGPGMRAALEDVGIIVLENEAVAVKRPGGDFWVAGLADDTTREPNLQKTLAAVTDDLPVLMLSHDPATFIEMNERPVVTLCGHTHGGQIAVPFFGPVVIPGRAPMKYAYGHVVENNRDLIVTAGLGTSILPVRFNRRPEVIELTVQAI